MCDYSLMHVKSRPAAVGDKLVTKNFGTGTRGFIDAADESSATPTAVCVLPGTEIAFDNEVTIHGDVTPLKPPLARFRQINKSDPHIHHDALEFSDGHIILLTFVTEGQKAIVLQLPAAPKNKTEEQEQKRLEIVA